MRIDANSPTFDFRVKWVVWHAEWCRQLKTVVWVDDVTCEWAEFPKPLRVVNGVVVLRVHQAKKIMIRPDAALVVINPIDLDAHQEAVLDLELEHGTH